MPPTATETPSAAPALDRGRAEAFAGRVAEHLNGAAIALMISVGHRTGLFDTMAESGPATSRHIARRAGLEERYVREWLGAMVTGRIVELDAESRRYTLPDEHAACLTRAAWPENLAVPAQFVSVLGGVEDEVVRCFRSGGGVPYAAYAPRFDTVMEEESDQTVVSALVDRVLPMADGLRERLEAGIDVADVGCGRGRALLLLARTFPASRFVGYDLSEDAMAHARATARAYGLTNVRFVSRDVSTWDEPDAYDLITAFDAIHDQAHPDRVLANVRRALRPGGTFLMQDIKAASDVLDNLEHPFGPFLYTISCMHCMTVSLAQGGIGLGTCWGRETARRMLAVAGFDDVAVHELPHDPMNDFYVAWRNRA